ncbi:uncharacterized protein BP01DRAFT_328877 [Aspergillus saccharolyticus JOP 1030-1]|uniref:Ubiquitin-like domain-containing protein n=1 Tax=Aspergillus saccharolyticus JOP 1030-1 TaxID=1450539 RepID=A0A318Z1N0_9EURO|nr:hypothetical protein BP01DRAFT_328877 [Aspergillus saccharolyticus JOP 1030-1]PYH40926.1 hypothetical protein BP01DRAFT_328877 [Aspergillus saccharolyticus JOP 1030-1]
MRSFFNKPSWASRGDETQDVQFYRHASQVYNDIISTNQDMRRAHQNQGTTSRKRHIPNENHGPDTLPSRVCKTHGRSSSCQTPSESTASDCDLAQRGENTSSSQVPHPALRAAEGTDLHAIDRPMHSIVVKSQDKFVASDTLAAGCPSKSNRACIDVSQSTNTLSPTEPPLTPSKQLIPSEEPFVQILITSTIYNTRPLIVRRRLHQPLRDVRLAWLDRQGLPKELENSIYLTWKGKRLFDVTTCRSLGFGCKSQYLSRPNAYAVLQDDSKDLQIHIEATTGKSLDLDIGQSLSPAKLDQTADFTVVEQQFSKIVLMSPGLKDLRLRVNLQMHVSKLICLFRDARQIPPEHEVHLVFDGERLESGCTLAEYNLADDDLLDVIVK